MFAPSLLFLDKWHVLVTRTFSIVTLLASQQTQTGSEMESQVRIAIYRRGEGAAHGAPHNSTVL